jgi:hypothetical protein
MIKIVVGEKDRQFVMHKSALTARSQFFKNAMGGRWQEAHDGLVKLPEDDGDAFALYEQLVYTGKVPAFDDSEETERKHSNYGHNWVTCVSTHCKPEWENLCRLYVLAEKLQDVAAKNATTDAMIEKVQRKARIKGARSGLTECLPTPRAIDIMYEGTPGFCPGRQVLVHMFVMYEKGGYWVDYSSSGVPKDFLWDLLECMSLVREPPREKSTDSDSDGYDFPELLQPVEYHETEGEEWGSWQEWF